MHAQLLRFNVKSPPLNPFPLEISLSKSVSDRPSAGKKVEIKTMPPSLPILATNLKGWPILIDLIDHVAPRSGQRLGQRSRQIFGTVRKNSLKLRRPCVAAGLMKESTG